MPKDPIVSFYEGTGIDHRGRLLHQILNFTNLDIEDCHDFIQWLFPLDTPSSFNHFAPLITTETIETFKQFPLLHKNLLKSFQWIMHFYGFKIFYDKNNVPILGIGTNFHKQASIWLKPYNHNFLRLTRILKSLQLLGLSKYSQILYTCLTELVPKHLPKNSFTISEETLKFWADTQR